MTPNLLYVQSCRITAIVALTLFVLFSFLPAHAAPFTDANWSGVGSGLSGGEAGPHCDVSIAYTMVIKGNDLFVGGEFTSASGMNANYIVRWDGINWSPLGEGLDAAPSALAVIGKDLYVCGGFNRAGGIPAAGIAKWDGAHWSALGSGFDGNGFTWTVLSLAVSGTNLYVGGSFRMAGGVAVTNVARWNGTSWSSLGSGLDGVVYALAASESELYAAGEFYPAGDNATRRVAKWDGTNWSILGSGLGTSGVVVGGAPAVALAKVGQDLYAGGYFRTNSGSPINYIAKWNGNTWSPLGPGLPVVGVNPGAVRALAFSGSDLYAAGSFSMELNGRVTYHIAKWDGFRWSALGSGLGQFGYGAYALGLTGHDLYVGGNFSAADWNPTGSIAHAYLERPALSALRSGSNVKLSWPSFYGDFVLQQSAKAAGSSNWFNSVHSRSTNGSTITTTVPLGGSNQFFRLIAN